MKYDNDRENIINTIISRGGLMANCAKLYLNNEIMAHLFIIECSEQCHQKLAVEYWGKELVSNIIKYSKQFDKPDSIKTELTN